MPWSPRIMTCIYMLPGDGDEITACGVPVCVFCESPDQVVVVRSTQQLACLQFYLEEKSLATCVFALNADFSGGEAEV